MLKPQVRPSPCDFCPYRRDAPSGLWAAEEYAKLPAYDAPTEEQPFQPFHCHQAPAMFCAGWAQVGMSHGRAFELLALRLFGHGCAIPEPTVPLFASGVEAAEHGLHDLKRPGLAARAAMAALYGRYRRIRDNNTRPARRRRRRNEVPDNATKLPDDTPQQD